ncbi:MAG: sulfurtransferase TusA family protein [Sneathiellales bacterium]|nr:sulfurtransferase TusA family protein [Sneathiellales bacterium]
MSSTDHLLDTTGLNCPLPVLKTKKKVKELAVGDVLTVIATDPASVIDFAHYCHVSGNILLSSDEENQVFTYKIEVVSR